MIGVQNVKATDYYNLSFDLTDRPASDWSSISPNVPGKTRTYNVEVNKTGGFLLVWGYSTTAEGITSNDEHLAVRYLTEGATVKFTLKESAQISNLALTQNDDKIDRSESGNTLTFRVNSSDVHMVELKASASVCITHLDITLPIPATYSYPLTGLGGSAWKSISPTVVGYGRTYDVAVNGTESNMMVWGWDTGNTGVVSNDEWMGIRNLNQGDEVALTFAAGSSPSDVTLEPNDDETQLTSSISGQVLNANIVANRRMFELTPKADVTIEKLTITRNRIDLTSFIKNPRFIDADVSNNNLTALSGWTFERTGGNGNLQSTIAEFWNCTFDVKQSISNLPNGKYTLSVKATSKDGKGELYATSNGVTETTSLVKTSEGDSFASIVEEINKSHGDKHRQSVTVYVTDGSLEIGVRQTGSADWNTWIVMGEFSLAYEEPTIAMSATKLPASGEMAADTWYYYDFAATDDYYFAASSNLSGIEYTTDGTKLVSESGTSLSKKIESIAAGSKYYFSSTEAQTLTIVREDLTNLLANPSFELKSAGTAQDAVKTSSGNEALTLYGWTENLNGINDLRNSEWVNNTTSGTSSKYNDAITSEDGTWHYYARKGWSDQNTADITLTSNDMTLPRGYYVLSCKYLLEENSRSGNPSNGSFLTLKAMSETTPVAAQESPKAYTSNVENATYTHTEWQTLSVAFNVTSESTIKAVLALTPRGGVNTEVHVDDFRLTYSPFADAADYAELTTAISTAEAYTLGFDAGEYAPYNVLPILNAAKAIKSDENNGYSTVRELINALNGITANATEVNAFYDGNFAIQSEQTTGPTALAGWNNPEGIRQLIKNTETYPGLNSASAKAAVFAWGSTTLIYGEKAGYTIPLKGHTIYELSLKICGWKDGDMGYVNVDVKNSKNEGLATYTTASVTKRITESEPWAEYNLLFTTGDAGIYKFGMWTSKHTTFTDLVLKKATAEKIKPLLLTEITNANNIYNDGVNVGTGVFQIPGAAGTAFAGAIDEAQAVYDNSATADEVSAAIDALKDAEEDYANAELNAPDAEKRYNVSIVEAGKAWDGNAVTFIAGGRNDQGNYGVKYLAAANVNWNQALKFTPVLDTPNTYKISAIRVEDGSEQYLTTGTTYGGNNDQIRTTDNASAAMLIKVEATSTANQFQLRNVAANKIIANNNNNDMYTAGSANFTIAEASQAKPKATIVDGSNWATFISPFSVSLDDLKGVDAAYTAENNDGAIRTVAVENNTIPANTPVLLYRESNSGKFEKELSGWGTAAKSTYTVGLLTGSYELADIPYDAETAKNNYVLQMNGGVVAFYNVKETGLKVGAYRAYLTMPEESEARAVLFFPEDPTAINTIEAADAETEGGLKDGKYLIGNKIVLVKNGVKFGANGQKLN